MSRRLGSTGPLATATALVTILVTVMTVPTTLVTPAAAASPTATTPAQRRTTIDLARYESRVLAQVNRRRTAHGRRAVHRISPCVGRLSERWAARLARTGGFYHRDQHVVLDRCHMHWAGEALARGTAMLPGQAVRAWMHSREHRAVILKRRADRAGLGVRLDTQGRVVLVLNFTDTRA